MIQLLDRFLGNLVGATQEIQDTSTGMGEKSRKTLQEASQTVEAIKWVDESTTAAATATTERSASIR